MLPTTAIHVNRAKRPSLRPSVDADVADGRWRADASAAERELRRSARARRCRRAATPGKQLLR